MGRGVRVAAGVLVGRGVLVGAGVSLGAGVKVDITTLFAPCANVLGVGVTRGELVAIERTKPMPQQNKITIPTIDKIEACFFAAGFCICSAGLIGVATCWGTIGLDNSRPQYLQTIASFWISSAQYGHFFMVAAFRPLGV